MEARDQNDTATTRGTPGATRSWERLDESHSRASSPGHLDVRLLAPELGENKFCCFKLPSMYQFVIVVTGYEYAHYPTVAWL